MGCGRGLVEGRGARYGARPAFGAFALLSLAALLLSACGAPDKFARRVDPKYGQPSSPRVVEEGQPVPKGLGTFRLGKPYTIAGRQYVPEFDPNYRIEGMASWYGADFHGRRTANGEIFDQHAITAAHPTLPIPSYARVTNLANRRSIIVRVNDRGPFARGRIVDVSSKTSELLGFKPYGVTRVRVEYVGPASLEGSDDRKLAATLRHDGQPAPAPSSVMLTATQPFVPQAEPTPLPRTPRPALVPAPPERPFELGYTPRSVQVTRVTAPPARTPRPVPAPPSERMRATQPEPAPSDSVAFTARGLY